MKTEKSLPYWIYYEDYQYYCEDCIHDRVDEINANKEFAEDIDYEAGEKCSYMYDGSAPHDYAVECCRCGRLIYSEIESEDFSIDPHLF